LQPAPTEMTLSPAADLAPSHGQLGMGRIKDLQILGGPPLVEIRTGEGSAGILHQVAGHVHGIIYEPLERLGLQCIGGVLSIAAVDEHAK
jgi:hypothetical protein